MSMPICIANDVKLKIQQIDLVNTFNYDPKSGRLYRKKNRRHSYNPPKLAGSFKASGYIQVSLNWTNFLNSRLVWIFHNGAIVDGSLVIDHINGERADDRIENLRLVTQSVNVQNSKEHRSGKIPGIGFHSTSKRWRAVRPTEFRGVKFSSNKNLGEYATKEEAIEALNASFDDRDILGGGK